MELEVMEQCHFRKLLNNSDHTYFVATRFCRTFFKLPNVDIFQPDLVAKSYCRTQI